LENESALNLSFGSSSVNKVDAEPETSPEKPSDSVPTNSLDEFKGQSITNMTVVQLKRNMKSVGLSTSGLKADLKKRLQEYIQKEATEAAQKEESKRKKKSPIKTLVIKGSGGASGDPSRRVQIDPSAFKFDVSDF
jgi:hypothetical protein